MCESIRGLLAKVWKDEVVDLAPGTHYLDEVMMVRVNGTIQKGMRHGGAGRDGGSSPCFLCPHALFLGTVRCY